jgi:hypothetical protein
MSKQTRTIILTRDLLEGIIEYMDQEKVEALEFGEKNFLDQLKEYNDQMFGKPEDEKELH